MNFDQKAVKFLANFYINGGQHWTHGPLRQRPLVPAQPKATVLLWAPQPEAAWEAMWPIGVQELQAHCRVPVGPVHFHEYPPICTQDLRELCESGSCLAVGRRLLSPQPRACFLQGWSDVTHRDRPAVQSESPFTQKADFNQEQKWPSPADYRPLSRPACPAFSFGGPRPASKALEAPSGRGLLRTEGAGIRAQPPLAPEARKLPSPSPNTYNIFPGCRLRSPRPPAFSMSRSPAFTAWVTSARSPGPAAYHVEDCYDSRFPSAPGVVIQGVRRSKRHDTGPFCTL
eukprot:XP_005625485.1 protein STPG3 [Canis lupus familiaris]